MNVGWLELHSDMAFRENLSINTCGALIDLFLLFSIIPNLSFERCWEDFVVIRGDVDEPRAGQSTDPVRRLSRLN